MVEHVGHDLVHVLEAHRRPTRQQRHSPGRLRGGDRGPRRSAVGHVLADDLRGRGVLGVARRDQTGDVATHRGRQHHPFHQRKKAPQLRLADQALGRPRLAPPTRAQDLFEHLHPRLLHGQFEQEPVHLCLGQRVGALQVHGVLRREHEERLSQRPGLTAHRHPPFLHRLEHRRLGLGRGAVDLVGQQNVGEDRAGLKLHPPRPVGRLLQDRGAQDVAGHQVRGELHPAEAQRHQLPQRLDQHRLAYARHALQQDVPAAQHPRQHQAVQLRLPQQHRVQVRQQLVAQLDRRRQFFGLKQPFRGNGRIMHVGSRSIAWTRIGRPAARSPAINTPHDAGGGPSVTCRPAFGTQKIHAN